MFFASRRQGVADRADDVEGLVQLSGHFDGGAILHVEAFLEGGCAEHNVPLADFQVPVPELLSS